MKPAPSHFARFPVAVATLLLALSAPWPQPALAQDPPTDLGQYEGNYRLPILADPMGFFVRDGTLHLKEGGLGGDGQEVPLIYRDGRFVIGPAHPNAFEFRIVDGEVRLVLHAGGNEFEGERIVGELPRGGEIFNLSDAEVWEQYWTDLRNEGLTSQQMRERYLSAVAEELGIPIPELEREIEEKTPYWFFLLRAPTRIPEVFEAFLSVGVFQGLAPKPLEWQIRGDSLIERLRADEHISVEEVAFSSSIADISPMYGEVAYDPTKRKMPIVVIQAGGDRTSASSNG